MLEAARPLEKYPLRSYFLMMELISYAHNLEQDPSHSLLERMHDPQYLKILIL